MLFCNNKKMKIGIYDPYLDTLSGGEKYMLSIASCLSSENQVYIFWDKTKESEIRKKAHQKLGIDLSNVKFYPNIFDKKTSLLSRIVQSRQFNSIIYLSDGSIPFVGANLFIHFQFPVEWVDGESLKTQIKLRFVKKIFCNSYFTKSFIDKKLSIKSDILYPPVNLHVNKNIKKENVILHVGRFNVDIAGTNYKKQDVMVNIFKKMVDSGLKNWKFILTVGVREEDKDKLNELKKITEGYPIELMENISNQMLWEFYSKAKIYWHATGFGENLEKNPEKAEHFGISTVEAMGAGCVPVVIDAGGQKEIVKNGINGFLWNNEKELIDRTREVISNIKLWQKLSLEAINNAQKFVGNRFCTDLNKIIDL